jgi:hypothetical protein
MDVVKLRKLAHKSMWTYGKYDGYTVSNIIITNKIYLLWAYYNLEKISFIDEILDDFANTYDNFKLIDKPGKDPDYYKSIRRFSYNDLTKQQLFNKMTANRINGKQHSQALLTAYRKAKSKEIHSFRNEHLSKESLQALNHGNSYNIQVIVRPKNK